MKRKLLPPPYKDDDETIDDPTLSEEQKTQYRQNRKVAEKRIIRFWLKVKKNKPYDRKSIAWNPSEVPCMNNLIIRICDYWNHRYRSDTGERVNGFAKALDTYNKALTVAYKWSDDDIWSYFELSIWPKLYKYRKFTNQDYDYTENQLKNDIVKYYHLWKSWTKFDTCRIKNLENLNTSYATITIRTDFSIGSHFPLYQMPIRLTEIEQYGYLINHDTNWVASHTCHTKQCIICTVGESKSYNTHRNHCIAFTLVNGYIIWTCNHEPKCRDYGIQAFY